MSESIIRKIEALLAKANNTACTEAEAAAFNAKAHELMLKYNIERGQLNSTKEVERGHLTLEVQLRPWSQNVLSGLTKLYYCKYFSQSRGRSHVITIIGEKQNLAVCHAICIMVLRSIQTAARQNAGGRSFMTGAGMEVYRRCMEMYVAAHSTLPPSGMSSVTARIEHERSATALVTLDRSEASGNMDYIQKTMGVNLRERRSPGAQVRDLDAFGRGVQHGKSVQLRQNLLGHNS